MDWKDFDVRLAYSDQHFMWVYLNPHRVPWEAQEMLNSPKYYEIGLRPKLRDTPRLYYGMNRQKKAQKAGTLPVVSSEQGGIAGIVMRLYLRQEARVPRHRIIRELLSFKDFIGSNKIYYKRDTYNGVLLFRTAQIIYVHGLDPLFLGVIPIRFSFLLTESLAGRGARTKGTDGIDKVTFKKNVVNNELIDKFNQVLSGSHRWRFSPPKEIVVESPRGKFRPIKVSTCIDQVFVYMLLTLVGPLVDKYLDRVTLNSNIVFTGGRAQFGTQSALKHWKTVEKHFSEDAIIPEFSVISEDISDYFPSIPRGKVYGMLARIGVPKWLIRAIKDNQDTMLMFERKNKGLCQGSCLSPILAVLFSAFVVDKYDIKANKGIVACTFYLDDVTIFGETESVLPLKDKLQKSFERYSGLTFKAVKSQRSNSSDKTNIKGVKSLGWVIKPRILNLTSKQGRKFKSVQLVVRPPRGWFKLQDIKDAWTSNQSRARSIFLGRLNYYHFCVPERTAILRQAGNIRFSIMRSKKSSVTRMYKLNSKTRLKDYNYIAEWFEVVYNMPFQSRVKHVKYSALLRSLVYLDMDSYSSETNTIQTDRTFVHFTGALIPKGTKINLRSKLFQGMIDLEVGLWAHYEHITAPSFEVQIGADPTGSSVNAES
jgi:hypothetical protein